MISCLDSGLILSHVRADMGSQEPADMGPRIGRYGSRAASARVSYLAIFFYIKVGHQVP